MKVSIIIPVYNVEPYLRECLDSVLHQTLQEIEVIVINDGSTDKSLSILMEYQSLFEHFILVNQVNKGTSAARNIGLKLATGEYVYFLDSDDYLAPNAMQICYEEAKVNQLDILMFNVNHFTHENHNIEPFYRPEIRAVVLSGLDFFKEFYQSINYNAAICYQFYRRIFLIEQQLLFHKGIVHEFELFTFQGLLVASKVKYLPLNLYFRRIREDSITTSMPKEHRVRSLIVIVHEIESFCLKQKHLDQDAVKKNIQAVIEQFYYRILYDCDLYDLKWIRDEIAQEIRGKMLINLELNMQVDAPGLFYHRQLYFKEIEEE